MTAYKGLTEELEELLPRELNISIPSTDTDLFAEGILDSFGLVNLLFLIERRWGVQVSIEEMELDNFRTVERIAAFISSENKTTVS